MTDHKPLTAAQIDAIETRAARTGSGDIPGLCRLREDDIPALVRDLRAAREQLGWAAAALGAAASHMATMPMPTEACRTETLRMIRRCDDVEAACRALSARADLPEET